MSITKRLWDIARSNANDFASALTGDDNGLTKEEKAALDEELRQTLGKRAGARARRVRDAAEDAWDKAFEAAQSGGGGYRPGGPVPKRQLDEWYRTLEVDSGAEFAVIRRSYRKLLAKYHPDRYASEPEKYEAATEVARKITVAYNGLKSHLGEG